MKVSVLLTFEKKAIKMGVNHEKPHLLQVIHDIYKDSKHYKEIDGIFLEQKKAKKKK